MTSCSTRRPPSPSTSARYPEAGLAPPAGTAERALFYRWLVHLTNTPQAEYRSWFYPREFVTEEAAAPAVKDAAEQRLNAIFDRIASQLGSGPWLLGERFSAGDLYLFLLIRWGRAMPRPPPTLAPLGALAERVLARPAVQAALAAEGLQPPMV